MREREREFDWRQKRQRERKGQNKVERVMLVDNKDGLKVYSYFSILQRDDSALPQPRGLQIFLAG